MWHSGLLRRIYRDVVPVCSGKGRTMVATKARQFIVTGLSTLGLLGSLTVGSANASGLDQAQTVLATYNHKQINLSEGWQGANVCSEESIGNVKCYNIPQGNKRNNSITPKGSIEDCPYGYACLWDRAGANGHRLQFHDPGARTLGKYHFRDRASSAYNNRPQHGFELTDYRDWQPDPSLIIGAGAYTNLRNEKYNYNSDESWDNKADSVYVY